MIKHDGKYYTCYSTGNAIVVTESRFMTKVENKRVVWSTPTNGWNANNVWAPELHFLDGKWYIYYAAGERPGGPYIYQRSGVLECDIPLGDYSDKGMLITGDDPNSSSTNVWAIDLTILNLKGKRYAVWSGWEKQENTDQTAQHLYIAPMVNPWTLGKRVKISSADKEWELGEAFGLEEGPEVLVNGENTFIVYSTRGSWTIHYKLGMLYLKSADSDPLNPNSWEKIGPVFQGTSTVYGVGHCSFTTSPDDSENWIIYHSKKGPELGWDRNIRMQKFTYDEKEFPVFGQPVNPGPLQRPSGEIEIELSK
jgi:GH43 family beta-xylosidase